MSTGSAYDVVVIGGGPAGIAAARAAAAAGARVALAEQGRPGGACVHETCVPTEILLHAISAYLGAQHLDALGIARLGSGYQARRAADRKDQLVRSLSATVARGLAALPVDVLAGFARLTAPGRVAVRSAGLDQELTAGAVVLAAGCAWAPPDIPGLPAALLATPDVIQSAASVPGRVAVLPSANSGGLFPLEYAAYLAAAGAEVDLLAGGPALLPGIDRELDALVVAGFEAAGAAVHLGLAAAAFENGKLLLRGDAGERLIETGLVLAADPRIPGTASLGGEILGLAAAGPLAVDASARCGPGVFAAGDVTGGAMLSSAASAQGTVAGANAAGASLTLPAAGLQPFVLHGPVPAAWVGLSEDAARAAGGGVVTGAADAAGTAQAVVTASEGTAVKIVADDLGQVLGVHAAGEGSPEIIGAAATLMQLEATLDDVAALRPWHPSWTEVLVDAARAAIT